MKNTVHPVRLDSVNIELEGVNLIEASAGTGKTYNIQNLAARLIVEKALPVNAIVIVTFTEKAARELTDRLRAILALLCDVLEGKNSDSGNQQRGADLLARFEALNIPRDVQLSRLKQALQDFDDNMVSTIHGFCGRVLSENAFDGSVAFHVRLEKNINNYVEKLLGDFCRMYRYNSAKVPGWDDIALSDLDDLVKTVLRHHKLEMNFQRPQYASAEALAARAAELQNALLGYSGYGAALEILQNSLNKIGDYSGNDYLALCRSALDDLHNGDKCSFEDCCKVCTLLAPENFRDKGKAARNLKAFVNEYICSNELFVLAEEITRFVKVDSKLFLQLQALEFVRNGLEQCKEQENFQSFDDLLLKVFAAVQEPDFRHIMQEKYQIGIIDEFQDTDTVQYGIFKAIFVEREKPAFFMVGDPKQAIYSFRGGDLAAYMTARNDCIAANGNICTLDINYRSSARLINEFNRFFEHEYTFASDEIFFNQAYAPDENPPGIACDGVEMEHPLQLDMQENLSSNELQKKCAHEIVFMLNSKRYTIPENGTMRLLSPGDIAVLAYDGYVLDGIRSELEKYNIPVIGERKSGIWSSPEAADLLVFMRGVLESASESQLRKALLSVIGGTTLAELDRSLPENAEKLLVRHLDFMALEQCWHENGTAAFMRMMFEKFDLKKRFSIMLNGERKLANYTQLGDLLSSAAQSMGLPPCGVLNFLQEKIARTDYDDESMEMLESDRAAVKLMTIHSSKGLQFPVVFLPQLAARAPLTRNDLKIYHRQNKLFCNPDRQDEGSLLTAGIEELQEIMRLVYVAVTRACYFCRISWGKVEKNRKIIKRTPMHWLFCMRHGVGGNLQDVLAGFLGLKEWEDLPKAQIPQGMLKINPFGAGLPELYIPEESAADLVAPETVDVVPDSWKIMSYSALPIHAAVGLTVGSVEDEAFDHDSNDEAFDDVNPAVPEAQAERLQDGIWAVPRGAGVGNAWHGILENCDFSLGIELSEIERFMKMYGFNDPVHHQAAYDMFQKLLSYKLPCGAALAELGRSQVLKEFEFLLDSPAGFDFKSLCNAVKDYMLYEFGAAPSGDEFFRMEGGFFTGFIDLVFEYNGKFYIADWKSNDLGGKAAAFYGAELKREMYDRHYPLQYLCYLAALMKYLELRLKKRFDEELYEQYIGDVYYIFLRGMSLEKSGGVFAAHVPYRTVRNLLDILNGGSMEGEL